MIICWNCHVDNNTLDLYKQWFVDNYGEPAVWFWASPDEEETIDELSRAPAFFYKPQAFKDHWFCCISDKNIAAHFKLVWT